MEYQVGMEQEPENLRSQFVTSKNRYGFVPDLHISFTEQHGILVK